MCTNQRSEGFHAFMDYYTGCFTSLHKFVTQFDKALARRHIDEMAVNKQTKEAVLARKTTISMEKGAFQIYTLANFKEVQKEMWESDVYLLNYILDDGNRGIYEAVNPEDMKDTRVLKYSRLKNYGNCSCHLWESTGIVCRHLFALLKHLHIVEFPPYFVLQRMTRDPRLGIIISPATVADPELGTIEEVVACFRSVHDAITGHRQLICHALGALEQLLGDVKEMKKWYHGADSSVENKGSSYSSRLASPAASAAEGDFLKNPEMANSRGRPKQRKKGTSTFVKN